VIIPGHKIVIKYYFFSSDNENPLFYVELINLKLSVLMRKFYTVVLSAFVSLIFSFRSSAQVSLTATAGTTCGSYTTLKAAFDAINAGTHQGAITIMVSGNTTETASAKLNASGAPANYTSVLIRPTAAAIISGSMNAPLIDFNGASNVTIDGRIAGTGTTRSLTLSNSSTLANGITTTARFINSTQNNLLTYLNIEGSVYGTVLIDSSLAGGGNSNIVISYNDIRPAGNNLPGYAVYSAGESASLANSGIQIVNNLIHDYFAPSGWSAGILLNPFNANWTISGNHFYQTAARSTTGNSIHVPVYVGSGDGHVVTNNFIGGSAASATGSATTIAGSFSNKFVGILLNAGTGAATKVDGNTITNISISSVPLANELSFAGIELDGGNVTIGHSAGNTIGSLTGTGAVTLNYSGVNTSFNYGIISFSAGNASMKNNRIGSVTAGGSNTGFVVLRGIEAGNYSTFTAENNMVGGTTANSLQVTSVNSTMAGIAMFPTVAGSTATVNANTINNITNNGSGTNAASIWGVYTNVSAAVNVILNFTNNSISNLSAPSATATTGSVIGINTVPATAGYTADANINGNIIINLSSGSTGSGFAVRGIHSSVFYNSFLNINSNTIHGLRSSAPNTAATSTTSLQGISSSSASGGTVNINDNTIYDLESTAAAVTHVNGIAAFYSSNTVPLTISGNRIYDLRNPNASSTGSVSGLLVRGSGGAGTFSMINNMISLSPANVEVYGLLNNAAATKLNAWHNSIYIGGTATGSNNSAAFFRNGAAVNTAIDSRNNIYYNVRTAGTGGHYSIINNATTPATGWTTADYNNLYTANPATAVLWGSTAMNLAAYKTASAKETNSKSIVVNFVNPATADLHLAGFSFTDANLNATAVSGVTTDFDKETRSTSTPKIGADEPMTCVAPVVNNLPPQLTVCATTTATFTATASGTALSYQWRKAGSNIAGATGASFTISSPTTADAGNYDVVVTNACGTATSTAITVTVNEAPFITSQPVAQVVCAGSAASFSAGATGSGLSYQWRKGGTNIAGATNATFTLPAAVAGDAGNYDVVINGACGLVTSRQAVLTVYAPPVISAQPATQAVCAGSAATFTVAATGGCLNYQWRKDGIDIAGANSATYTIPVTTAANAGNYDVVISNLCTTVSIAATLTVNAVTAISTQPSVQTVCAGSSASFTIAATGTNLSYQWRKAGTNIPGATNATYTIANTTSAEAGNYDVIVTGTCGSQTSNAVSLTVNAVTVITTQPSVQTVCAGTSASFTVAATGTNLSYQWRKAGTNIPGATSATYTIANATSTDAGNYDVVVTGSCGSQTSNGVSLTVNAVTAITTQPAAQTICSGTAATFSVSATGTNLVYQWRKGSTNITGANAATYTINSVTAADAGSYDVVITGACGTVTSSAVNLTVNPLTAISTQPVAQTVCSGSAASFSVAATGSGSLTYQWRLGGINIAGATASTYSIAATTPASAGNYDVVITGGCGSVTSNAVILTVNNCTAIGNVDPSVTASVLMPNIVRNRTLLSVEVSRATKIDYTVTDANGRIVMQFSRSFAAGRNTIALDFSRLSAGNYYITGTSSQGKTILLKFIRQ
jgi:Immunoglobulin I-set domain